jgi:hypothetical protein
MLGSSRVAAQLAASREGLGSMSEWKEVTMAYFKWLYRHFPGETEENQEKILSG